MYEKQNFYSGQILKASQLDAMENGIIDVERSVEDAKQLALKAENTANNICQEYDAFEPLTWDGVIGDKEVVDISHLIADDDENSGIIMQLVKISDVILNYEDLLGSSFTLKEKDTTHSGILLQEDLLAKELSEPYGIYSLKDYQIVSIFDIEKVNEAFGTDVKSTGTYFLIIPVFEAYSTNLEKKIIKKIDKKFLPETSSNVTSDVNMEKGTGENATQQTPRADKTNITNSEGQLCFEGDSPFVDDNITPFGGRGKCAVSLGGRTSAQATHSMAVNSKTVATGEEALATGYATIAAGGASFSGGSQTIARAEASTALGHKNDAAAPYTFVHGVQNVAGGLYQAVFGVANENNTDNLFEIGNGKLAEDGSVLERANALAVTRDGRVKVQNLDITAMEVNDLVPVAVLTQGIEMLEADRNIQNGEADGSIQQKYGAVNGVGAAAFGTHTQANAEAAMSCGAHTIANQYAQTVVGKYNKTDSANGSVFVVGGGESEESRRNALEVISDGEIVIYWNDAYYSLNLILNLISNAHGGPAFFDLAKK